MDTHIMTDSASANTISQFDRSFGRISGRGLSVVGEIYTPNGVHGITRQSKFVPVVD